MIREQPENGPVVVQTAPHGHVGNDASAPKLILIDGLVQSFSRDGRTLNTVHFDSLSYDLSPFAVSASARSNSVQEIQTLDLWHRAPESGGESWRSLAAAEVHSRSVKALIAFLAPVIGVAAILAGGFKRTGTAFRIVVAIALMLGVNSLRGALETEVSRNPDIWWILYSAPVLGAALVLALGWVGISRWRKTWDGIEGRLTPGWGR